MAIPSFCRRDAGFGEDERPLRLAPSTISVETTYGEMQVKVWIGGHGFPIVVLHGLSANSRIYLLWLGFLALFFKVIAVDLPGHGGTDQLPRGCEYMAGSGMVLNSVLDTLGVNYVGIIAHSMGARIACETASRTPNRVVVLILVDPVTGAAWDRRMRNVRRLPLLFAPLAAEFLQDFAVLLARIRQTDRSADLIRLGFDTYIGHVQHPMRSFVPATRVADQCPAQRAAARRDRPSRRADRGHVGGPGPAGLPRLRGGHRRDHQRATDRGAGLRSFLAAAEPGHGQTHPGREPGR